MTEDAVILPAQSSAVTKIQPVVETGGFFHWHTGGSFDDARKILTGGDTAATEYFKAKTSDKLSTAFRPTVESTERGPPE